MKFIPSLCFYFVTLLVNLQYLIPTDRSNNFVDGVIENFLFNIRSGNILQCLLQEWASYSPHSHSSSLKRALNNYRQKDITTKRSPECYLPYSIVLWLILHFGYWQYSTVPVQLGFKCLEPLSSCMHLHLQIKSFWKCILLISESTILLPIPKCYMKCITTWFDLSVLSAMLLAYNFNGA